MDTDEHKQRVFRNWLLSNSKEIIILWEFLAESLPFQVKRNDENFFKFVNYLYKDENMIVTY
jgi:hypothetical protein